MNISPIKQLSLPTQLLIVGAAIAQIALMPWFEIEVPYSEKLIVALAIGGLMVCGVLLLNLAVDLIDLLKHPTRFMFLLGIAITVASALGAWIGVSLSGMSSHFPETQQQAILIKLIVWGIYLGSAVSFFFMLHDRLSSANEAAWQARMQHSEGRKQLAETQLKLLQAQIEPHFLFNSLANILNLIDHDTAAGKRMLESFIKYLRLTLDKSRAELARLGDEMEVIEAYLNIFRIRMGDRLRVHIALSEVARQAEIPAMLLQPLVENAIVHGLEPSKTGGEIRIYDRIDEEGLHIFIEDSGVGLKTNGGSGGFGLKNVRERLTNLFGDAAELRIESNEPRGVRALLTIPLRTP